MNAMNQLQAEVNAKREEIEALRDEIEFVTEGLLPPDEVRANLMAECRRLGESLDLRLLSAAHPEGWQQSLRDMLTMNVAQGQKVHVGMLLAAVFGDDFGKALCRRLDALKYTPGPPSKDRPGLLESLRAKLLELERGEEALIVQAEAQGVEIPRRADADPAVVLDFDPHGDMPQSPLLRRIPTAATIR